MLLAAVLLITTTIRLSALSRRRETGIMRLVGASTLFIQLPFMLEGAIAATIGAAAGGRRRCGWASSTSSTTGSGESVALDPVREHVRRGSRSRPILIAVAIVLAAISSLVTLSRYTKV